MSSEGRRWLNPTQPQTLQIAVMLLYLNAIFAVIGAVIAGGLSLIGLGLAVAQAIGGYGIANERKWGYILGVVAAVLQLLVLILYFVEGLVVGLGVISLIFYIALVALLLHPQSREYQRIWFK
jgi:hypothetical protein